MSESSIALAAAVEAAPILKLWPEYSVQSIPACESKSRNFVITLLYVKGALLLIK